MLVQQNVQMEFVGVYSDNKRLSQYRQSRLTPSQLPLQVRQNDCVTTSDLPILRKCIFDNIHLATHQYKAKKSYPPENPWVGFLLYYTFRRTIGAFYFIGTITKLYASSLRPSTVYCGRTSGPQLPVPVPLRKPSMSMTVVCSEWRSSRCIERCMSA